MAELLLEPVKLTADNFRAYGQVVGSSPDGLQYGARDAQLNLSAGIPRLYIMNLKRTGLEFKRITHHASVTQCLGSLGAQAWYIAVAPPSIVQPDFPGAVQSRKGHYYLPPSPENVKLFKVDGPRFLKLHEGTWHAGPLFQEQESMDFYNLELSDTNVVDHTTHTFQTALRIVSESESEPTG